MRSMKQGSAPALRRAARGERPVAVMLVLAVLLAALLVIASPFHHGVDVPFSPVSVASPSEIQSYRPLVIGHRGDSSAPENSLQAIDNAGRNRADYAEVDARLTSDGKVVVFHDRRTGRLSADGENRLVSRTRLKDLQRMRMVSHDRMFRIPTLDEAIETARRAPNGLGLLIELKTDVRHAGKLTRGVMKAVENADFTHRTMIMSTNPDVVRVIRDLAPAPTWRVGYCHHARGRMDWRLGVDFLVVRSGLLDLKTLNGARERDIPVYAGVGAYSSEVARFLRLGASGVLGDDVRAIRGECERAVEAGSYGEIRVVSDVKRG